MSPSLLKGLEKTRFRLLPALRKLFTHRLKPEDWEKLEEILLQADLGVELSLQVVENLRRKGYFQPNRWEEGLKEELLSLLMKVDRSIRFSPVPPTVIMVVGINGSGKTTTIGKLAYRFQKEGKKVLLAASDTFRAAAIEQLQLWAERVGAEVVKHQYGSDPAAVAYDALNAARNRKSDILIIDTAGRVHTRRDLMEELKKIKRVLKKRFSSYYPPSYSSPQEILLVLDATTGQNGINQAEEFHNALNLTGIIVAKLDGTAKGGIIFAIEKKLGIPVKMVGVGEKMEDLVEFSPPVFVNNLLGK